MARQIVEELKLENAALDDARDRLQLKDRDGVGF
jgi:hypothetical protein